MLHTISVSLSLSLSLSSFFFLWFLWTGFHRTNSSLFFTDRYKKIDSIIYIYIHLCEKVAQTDSIKESKKYICS